MAEHRTWRENWDAVRVVLFTVLVVVLVAWLGFKGLVAAGMIMAIAERYTPRPAGHRYKTRMGCAECQHRMVLPDFTLARKQGVHECPKCGTGTLARYQPYVER